LLGFFVLLLIFVNYNFIDDFLERSFLDYEFVEVERVIDGDTVVVNGSSMRLLGINSPEKGEKYFSEARDFLESLVLGESLRIERVGLDRYGRELVYLFDDGNVNLKLVENGFANYYFPEGKEKYYSGFVDAWAECEVNLCEMSDEKCVVLKEFDYENEIVVLENVCSYNIGLDGWMIKDEGRKEYFFEDFVLVDEVSVVVDLGECVGEKDGVDEFESGVGGSEESSGGNILCWERSSYVWTKSGDTLFLRDGEGKLVLWERY